MSDYCNNGTTVQLTDYSKSPIYPYTKLNAVYDEDGNPLPGKLEYDATPTEGSKNAVQSGGVYTELAKKADKSEIPGVGNGIVNIYQGEELKGTFTMNQSEDVDINLGEGLTSVSWDDVTDKPDLLDVEYDEAQSLVSFTYK